MSLDHESKNEMMCYKLELWALTPFCVNMGFLGFKRDSSKIHDSVDVVRVANEMKPCGVKNLSSTISKHNLHGYELEYAYQLFEK